MNTRPIVMLAFLGAGIASLPGQTTSTGPVTDLLAGWRAEERVVTGGWTLATDGLRVAPGAAARCSLPGNVPPDYDLTVEFTRTGGDDAVAVILPVGDRSPAMELSAWNGVVHGLSRVDGRPARDESNPATFRPGRLENGRRQRLTVRVRTGSNPATVTAMLEDTPLFTWRGEASRLQPNLALNLTRPNTLGLAAHNSAVTFHRVTLQTPATTPRPPSPPAPAVRLTDSLAALGTAGNAGWEPFNGAGFVAATEAGRTVVRTVANAGAGDRGAYLKGTTFAEGTIELDLRGADRPGGSFLGVVFHGVDGGTYDAVYFRPFNFGHADPVRRGHAVQYMSHPTWPWDRLRAERAGQFEAVAKPEPGRDTWFRARIEVRNRRVRVFLDDAKDPCLDVAKLGALTQGKVGLWFNGVAAFANLKIERAK